MGSFSSARSVEKASQAFGHTVSHGLRYIADVGAVHIRRGSPLERVQSACTAARKLLPFDV